MKFLPYIVTLLSFLLLLGIIYTVTTEVSELREEVGLQDKRIKALKTKVKLHNQNAQRVIDEVRHIMSGKNFIPVYDWRTFLVWDVKEIEEESP